MRESATDVLWPAPRSEALASIRKRAALDAHDKVDDVPVGRARKTVEVRVVWVTHVNAKAGGPLLVERAQSPVPTATAAQLDAIRRSDILERALAL